MAAAFVPDWAVDLPKLSFEYPRMPRRLFHNTVDAIHGEARGRGQLKQAMRRCSEESLFYFVVYILHWTFLDNDFAYALCAKCQGDGRWGRMWILAREHYKSTVITIAETIRDVLLHPEETTLIYSYKFDIAKDNFYAPIKKELESNPRIQMIWPDVVYGPDEKPEVWTATALNVKRRANRKEFTLACASLFSQLTGTHYDKLIDDDCVTEENCQTEESIRQTRKYWEMSRNTGNTKALRYCTIGTFYSAGDLYCHIMKEGLCETVLQPCYDEDGRGVLYSNEALATKRKVLGSAVFATQMLLDPQAGAAMAFKREYIKWWRPSIFKGLNIYVFVDPAGEVSRRRDNTVILTIALDSADNFYLIDIIRDKLTLTQKTENLFRLYRTYRPRLVFYEKNGAACDVPHIEEEQARKNFRFPITKLVQTRNKGERIDSLLPLFEQGRIYFPEGGCVHRNWEGRDEDMLESFIRDELLVYPHCTHDDALDDLANILHPTCSEKMQRPDELSEEMEIYRAMQRKGMSLMPLGGSGEYDPFAEYRDSDGLSASRTNFALDFEERKGEWFS